MVVLLTIVLPQTRLETCVLELRENYLRHSPSKLHRNVFELTRKMKEVQQFDKRFLLLAFSR